MKHTPILKAARSLAFGIITMHAALFSLIYFAVSCKGLDPPRIRLEDRHIGCFINATKSLAARSPEFLKAMNSNRGDVEKAGKEQLGNVELTVRQAGCESYAEYAKVSFEVFKTMSVVYAEAFMSALDESAKKMHDDAMAACENMRDDPAFYNACVSQTRKQIGIAEEERQKELKKNKPYADMVLNKVKGMTDPHNAEVVMRHIRELGTMWSPQGAYYIK